MVMVTAALRCRTSVEDTVDLDSRFIELARKLIKVRKAGNPVSIDIITYSAVKNDLCLSVKLPVSVSKY